MKFIRIHDKYSACERLINVAQIRDISPDPVGRAQIVARGAVFTATESFDKIAGRLSALVGDEIA